MKKITRQEYLNDSSLFYDYYAQFVTEGMKHVVENRFGIEKLKDAYKKDEHLNSIPLAQWDVLSYAVTGVSQKMKELGDYLTQAGIVCIMKNAAKQVIEESENVIQ